MESLEGGLVDFRYTVYEGSLLLIGDAFEPIITVRLLSALSLKTSFLTIFLRGTTCISG